MIVPFSPGGAADIIGRVVAQKLSENLGQQVIVDNRAGASGNIGAEAAAKARGDGYTILLGALPPTPSTTPWNEWSSGMTWKGI
jgi:tripartite-type tricarboxylate transporter receptor subunit TctC